MSFEKGFNVFDRLKILGQYLLPKKLLTQLLGKLADTAGGRATAAAIGWFVRRYGVDMSEAAEPDIARYHSFNAFFTRELRADARPIAPVDFICPVDGAISQYGRINSNQIFQAKGHYYSTEALLAERAGMATPYENGCFATLYLSPRDYHRIHMPCNGRLLRMIYVPGTLFSVNPLTAREVPGLFARNERVVCEFETEFGSFVMVLVGATIVGSMATVWHGVVNPPRPGDIREWNYSTENIRLRKGEEMGRFLLGSTVVMLFPPNVLEFNEEWAPERQVRMGEPMSQPGANVASSAE